MERELSLREVGTSSEAYRGTPYAGMSPRQMLRDPSVAVVVVYAAIPAGAPMGARFDVYVQAVNGGGLTSLEGGQLWSTDLRLGPPTTIGGYRTRGIAQARGPVFINPFAEPGTEDGMTRTIGRILGGGEITNSSNIDMVLDNASHSRAAAIQEAVLDRFPPMPGDRDPVARGRNASVIEITVPAAYRDKSDEFLRLLEHTQIDRSFPQEYAKRYTEALRTQPGLSENLSWCLQALGRPAIPFLREMYDSSEVIPRMAALRAGAALGDPRAADPLKDLARSGPAAVRSEAITLLGKLDAGPTVDLALRDILSDPILQYRVAAYEALADRAERVQMRRWMAELEARPATARIVQVGSTLGHLDRIEMAGDSIQGVRRIRVPGKFILDIVPAGDELIYITQQGTPRIVLFGSSIELNRPLLMSAWSDRLMISAESATDDIRLYYRDLRTGRGAAHKPGNSLENLIRFMAQQPSPEDPRPGLGLTYSEVVGALYAIQQAGGVNAAFATEQDKLLAAVLKASESGRIEDRPETGHDAPELVVYDAVKARPAAPEEKPSLVEPLPPRVVDPKKE